MATSAILHPIPTSHRTKGGVLPAAYQETHWYAAYTSANHEKRVAVQLGQRSVEHFLPLYDSVRRWKDRRVQLQLPLFPGYVFVRLALRDRFRVLQIPSVACLVGFGGSPTPIEEAEVEAIRACLVQGVLAEPYPFLTIGRQARIRTGPLTGFGGFWFGEKDGPASFFLWT